MSGKAVFISALLLASGFFVKVFIGDLNLDWAEDGPETPPAVELEDVVLRRTYSGDMWNFNVKSITRVKGVGDLTGITGERIGSGGSAWTISSPFGEYLESPDRLTLKSGSGTFKDRDEKFLWTAPAVVFGGLSKDRWSFPFGVRVSGDRYNLEGGRGSGSAGGTVFLEKGVMEWRSPESGR